MNFSLYKKLWILSGFEFSEKEKEASSSSLVLWRFAGQVTILRIVLFLARVIVGAVLCHHLSMFPLLIVITTWIASVVVEGLTRFPALITRKSATLCI